VKDEVDAFLECGILTHGFLRLRCGDCAHEKLVAFSLKRRGICVKGARFRAGVVPPWLVQLRALWGPTAAFDRPAFPPRPWTGIEAAMGAGSKLEKILKWRQQLKPTARYTACTRWPRRPKATRPPWTEIGTAWPYKDGKGFSLKLEFMPIGEADLVIREAQSVIGSETWAHSNRPTMAPQWPLSGGRRGVPEDNRLSSVVPYFACCTAGSRSFAALL
jgi:hypothetical protein